MQTVWCCVGAGVIWCVLAYPCLMCRTAAHPTLSAFCRALEATCAEVNHLVMTGGVCEVCEAVGKWETGNKSVRQSSANKCVSTHLACAQLLKRV